MGWVEFVVSLIVFLALHAIPVRPTIKSRITSLIGSRGFTIAYSLISTATLVWIITAANRAPFVELWPLTMAARHATLAIMALAILILALAIGRPNPLSFGGMHNDQFDPESPGIIGWSRHPLLVAIGLWALAHLIANGTLAFVILFGLFAGFAALGTKIIDRRKRRLMGAEWDQLSQTKRSLSPSANGVIRVTLGALLYVLILTIHAAVFGVYPLG